MIIKIIIAISAFVLTLSSVLNFKRAKTLAIGSAMFLFIFGIINEKNNSDAQQQLTNQIAEVNKELESANKSLLSATNEIRRLKDGDIFISFTIRLAITDELKPRLANVIQKIDEFGPDISRAETQLLWSPSDRYCDLTTRPKKCFLSTVYVPYASELYPKSQNIWDTLDMLLYSSTVSLKLGSCRFGRKAFQFSETFTHGSNQSVPYTGLYLTLKRDQYANVESLEISADRLFIPKISLLENNFQRNLVDCVKSDQELFWVEIRPGARHIAPDALNAVYAALEHAELIRADATVFDQRHELELDEAIKEWGVFRVKAKLFSSSDF